MTRTNLKYLIKNTDFFSNECILKNTLAVSESELKSIISKELKNMENSEIDNFISSFKNQNNYNLFKEYLLKFANS